MGKDGNVGIGAHAQYYWVSRQVDGATPQPVQKMTYEKLMLFVVKQQKLTRNWVTYYEASAFGFRTSSRLSVQFPHSDPLFSPFFNLKSKNRFLLPFSRVITA
jgi:hypothetical protein